MFRPVKLVRVTVQTGEESIPAVMQVLGRLKLLHLINLRETHLGRVGYSGTVDNVLLGRYSRILQQAGKWLSILPAFSPEEHEEQQEEEEDFRLDREIFRLEERLSHISSELQAPLEEMESLDAEVAEYDTLLARLSLLLPADPDFDRLSAMHYAVWRAGLVPSSGMDRLEASLADIHHVLVPVSRKDKRQVLIACCLKEDEDVMLRALKSAFWDAIEIPSDIHGTASSAVEQLETVLEEKKERLAALRAEREKLAQKFVPELRRISAHAEFALALLKAVGKFGKIDHTWIISGWMPADLVPELKQQLKKAAGDMVMVDVISPEDIREVRSGVLTLPVLFNNPVLIRPFQRLVTMYGTPSYREVEPTAVFAITFLILFGIMFGDVGHGACLFAIGWYVFRRMFRFMDYGIILMECGISSMLFGVLYGSVFGSEDLIPALWIRPMEHIDFFMEVAAGLGLAMISTGLVLNIINVIRYRRYSELLSASGLAGALLYWLAAGLAIKWVLKGAPGPEEMLAAGLAAGVLVLVMVAYRPVMALLCRGEGPVPGRPSPPGVGITLLESLIEVADDLLRYLGNTVSFVRVAAFALAHAGLFIAVFTLADMVSQAHGTGFLYYMTMIAGNVVIIALEGLVVSIQTVRLEYYEFFSKFFRGGGEAFTPLSGRTVSH